MHRYLPLCLGQQINSFPGPENSQQITSFVHFWTGLYLNKTCKSKLITTCLSAVYQISLQFYLSRECRKFETLFRKLTSATCRAPHTTPSMVSGLSAQKERVHTQLHLLQLESILDTHLKNQQSQLYLRFTANLSVKLSWCSIHANTMQKQLPP